MSRFRARDGRTLPYFQIVKADLSRLAQVCEARQLPYARSVYFAVVEIANDQRSEAAEASLAEVARRAGVSRTTVTKVTATLVEAGVLAVESGRENGGPNEWVLLSAEGAEGDRTTVRGDRATVTPMPVPRSGGDRTAATPIETGQEEKKALSSSSSVGTRDSRGTDEEMQVDALALLKRKVKVGTRIVTEDEMKIAAAVLSEWNRQAGSGLGLGAHLTPIVGRIRERPSWDADKHVRLVQSAWRLRWWERNGRKRGGRPGIEVIYGNARVFEKVAQDARDEAAGRAIEAPTAADGVDELDRRRLAALNRLMNGGADDEG